MIPDMTTKIGPGADTERAAESRPIGCGPLTQADTNARDDRRAAILVAVGLAISGLFIMQGRDALLHFDDLTHYLFAKWAWTYPAYLLDEWGRPGFTILHVLPAKLGWPMCKVLSACLTAWSAWFAFRIAQGMRLRHAWAAVLFAYGQPLFFQLSQTTLTETALAFYVSLAVYLAQRGRWSWSAAVISLGMVTRHEAVVFLPVWLIVARRSGVDLRRLLPILWAPVLVNVLAPIVGYRPLFEKFLEPHPTTQYGAGSWLTYFSKSLEAWGPGVTVPALAGLWTAWRAPRGGLVAGGVVGYFAAQTAIRALGMFDSGGYARFLVGISPLVAVAALAGWLDLWNRDKRAWQRAVLTTAAVMVLLWASMERHVTVATRTGNLIIELPHVWTAMRAVRIATAVVVVLALASIAIGRTGRHRRWARALVPAALAIMMPVTSYALCHRLALPPEAAPIGEVVTWLDANGYADREIISAVVWLDYAKGYTLSPLRPSVRERLEQAAIGTLFAWEKQFAGSQDHGLSGREFAFSRSWRRVLASPEARPGDGPYLIIYEKTAPWKKQRRE